MSKQNTRYCERCGWGQSTEQGGTNDADDLRLALEQCGKDGARTDTERILANRALRRIRHLEADAKLVAQMRGMARVNAIDTVARVIGCPKPAATDLVNALLDLIEGIWMASDSGIQRLAEGLRWLTD